MEHMAELQALYREKNAHLEANLEAVPPRDFYREIFPEGAFERKGHYEDSKGNGIALTIQSGIALEIFGGGRAKQHIVTDEHWEMDGLMGAEFVIMAPVSYFGKRRIAKNARYLYAMVFDLDGVGMVQLADVLHQMNRMIIPKATFVVNSGTGLHLYYVLDEPEPMYPMNQKYLKEIKYALTPHIWNRYTSTIKKPQIQGVVQGFRVVGSSSKLGKEYPVAAFRCGGKVSLDYLLHFIPDSNKERSRVQAVAEKSRLPLNEAKEKYPEWYERRIVRKERSGRWHVNRAVYEWWLDRIRDEITVGHRYFAIMTLAVYAVKCDIREDELRRDAYSLLGGYDEMSTDNNNRFTEDDIVCALEMYNESYVTFPRDDIAKIAGLRIERNKRNGRKQLDHLRRARAVQEIDYPEGSWRDGNGRPSARQRVEEYRQRQPDGRKADCIRETGLSKKTVYKWWDAEEDRKTGWKQYYSDQS